MTFANLLAQPGPVLALAPMQDVTDLPFWTLMARYGGADVNYTEYFRVHTDYHLEKSILRSITENPTGRPVIAQMIGNDIPALVRCARELAQHPIAAIDLNLGCPAPIVYKKCAGGGLLRDLPRVDAILGALREAIPGAFTVKTRVGFDDPATLDQLLPIFARHSLDLLTVHGRTVLEMYRPGVHYDRIAQAAQFLKCPVLANGDVSTPADAQRILATTGARGLMIGRGAIRNPWLFQQIRCALAGASPSLPTGRDLLAYITALYHAVCSPQVSELDQVQKMKKYLSFIAPGAEPTGQFLYEIRRVHTKPNFFETCSRWLEHDHPLT